MPILDALKSRANAEKAAKMRAYHKTEREVLGLSNPEIDQLVKAYRTTPENDLQLAQDLWATGILEARIMAGKLLTRGKLTPEMDEEYWQIMRALAADFDGWAIADHIAMAAHRRVLNPVQRHVELKDWTNSPHMWSKRAALIYTLPFARLAQPNQDQKQAIETLLSWAEKYTQDEEWFIQKSFAWWLREYSKKNPERIAAFLQENGNNMKHFARREASKYL